MQPLPVGPRVVVPAHALTLEAVRSGGPGGQNVNKVATKVQLHVELAAIEGLSEAQRRRLLDRARTRLDAEGRLLIVSQRTRHQHMNLEDARAKLAEFIAAALVAPKRRIPTKPSRSAKARRLTEKKAHGEKKQSRRWRDDP